MQKYLIVSLCIVATFIAVEARPWYEDSSYDTNGEDSNDEFSENGYSEQAFGSGYRSDTGYGNRIASNSRSLGGYGSSNYGSSGTRGNGDGSSRNGNNGYGSNGYDSNSHGSNGYEGNGYGNNGYSNNGNGAGMRRSKDRSNGSSDFDDGGFVPRSCPHCKINSLGNGNNNIHTFNLPKEAFN
ncbi:N66 matrix protein-like [Melitaea cinxia]|uniref:N66 matrix protein-like n=1 Tax=Melitaea cinxia TaxID=113334 RepID=UPI001E274BA2|nr:N66 matrix protein-like [Melitaea cinxia]